MPYLTTAQVRTLPNMADQTKPTDAQITKAVDWFETAFEDYTNVAWIPRTITETLNGDGGSLLKLTHRYIRPPITAASITTNGVATPLTAAELADLVVYDNGLVARLSLGRWPLGRRNISVTYSHGFTTPPPDVIEAAEMAVRSRLLDGAVGNRQVSVATEAGIIRNTTQGPNKPFDLDFVNEVANRRRHPDIGIG